LCSGAQTLFVLCNIAQKIATHLESTYDRRKCASSLEGAHRLPEDNIYVPKDVDAKNQRNKKLGAFVGHFMNRKALYLQNKQPILLYPST
jgi:hypothetical protein